jgi:hypothetical protein
LDAAGSALVYSTFFGGVLYDDARAVTVDSFGGAVFAGETLSKDFPTTPDGFDTSFAGLRDAFVTRIDPNGARVVYSTFLGGTDNETAYSLETHDPRRATVTGFTDSYDFPTTKGSYDRVYNGYTDVFVSRLNVCGTASWTNYGSGWPGTNGIPAFTSSANPVLCQVIHLSLENSSPALTPAVVFMGWNEASLKTDWDGTLLVLPILATPILLPPQGMVFTIHVPCDGSFCGLPAYLQVLEIDSGASKGVSFTPGLKLLLGDSS